MGRHKLRPLRCVLYESSIPVGTIARGVAGIYLLRNLACSVVHVTYIAVDRACDPRYSGTQFAAVGCVTFCLMPPNIHSDSACTVLYLHSL